MPPDRPPVPTRPAGERTRRGTDAGARAGPRPPRRTGAAAADRRGEVAVRLGQSRACGGSRRRSSHRPHLPSRGGRRARQPAAGATASRRSSSCRGRARCRRVLPGRPPDERAGVPRGAFLLRHGWSAEARDLGVLRRPPWAGRLESAHHLVRPGRRFVTRSPGYGRAHGSPVCSPEPPRSSWPSPARSCRLAHPGRTGVVDRELEVSTPRGKFWRRFSHDGYGETRSGGQWVITDPAPTARSAAAGRSSPASAGSTP